MFHILQQYINRFSSPFSKLNNLYQKSIDLRNILVKLWYDIRSKSYFFAQFFALFTFMLVRCLMIFYLIDGIIFYHKTFSNNSSFNSVIYLYIILLVLYYYIYYYYIITYFEMQLHNFSMHLHVEISPYR